MGASVNEAIRATWDPAQYRRFGGHRLRPALELLERIDHPGPRLIYDLGTGTGEIPRIMAARWPQARIVGTDSSPAMLEKARAAAPAIGSGAAEPEWIEADVRDWAPEAGTDIVYSNAMFQWVTGHETLFPRLVGALEPGAVFAVQMPLSWGQPSHAALREVLSGFGTPELRAEMGRKWVEAPDWYYDLLRPLVAGLDIWTTTYLQVLEGEDPVLEWVKGTALRPVLDALDEGERAAFLAVYRDRLRTLYPPRAGGETLFPFERLFIVASR